MAKCRQLKRHLAGSFNGMHLYLPWAKITDHRFANYYYYYYY